MREHAIVLKNVFCLLTNPATQPISGADVLVKDGIVQHIAPKGDIIVPRGARVINCSKHVVVPGFVNTHHHFYQTLTRNHPAVQNAELFDWLTFLYNVWKLL